MPDEIRDRLRLPIAVGVFVMWVLAGLGAIYRDDVQVFALANIPFGILMGYLFGNVIIRRAENGNK